MNLVQIKEYIRDRKLVPLQDIAIHFKTEVNTVQPMLDIWVRKGKVKNMLVTSAAKMVAASVILQRLRPMSGLDDG